jgi:hypothetical protein
VRPLVGVPCWNLKQGYGSFLTFEFGEPNLEIGKVRKWKTESPRRVVTLRGQWHLWIYCCEWTIERYDQQLAYSESHRSAIHIACDHLHGQALTDIDVNPSDGRTRFKFDLGGELLTKPYGEELTEQWMLFDPEGQVLSVRSDGKASYNASNGKPDERNWMPIENSPT